MKLGETVMSQLFPPFSTGEYNYCVACIMAAAISTFLWTKNLSPKTPIVKQWQEQNHISDEAPDETEPAVKLSAHSCIAVVDMHC